MPDRSTVPLGPFVEGLVAQRSRAERERLLVALPLELGLASAAAIWRVLPPPPGFRKGGWREILAVGSREALPRQAEVELAFGAPSASRLPPGERVLTCDLEGLPCALALGGLDPEREEDLDLLEAVLVAFAAIEEASLGPARGGLLESVAAPLPRTRTAPRRLPPEMRHDVRHHLASIRTTQELLHRYGIELSGEERDHFAEVLEREVRRASGLLLRAVGSPLDDEADRSVGARAADVVRDVVRSEQGSTRAAGQVLALTIDPRCEQARVAFDEIDLERLLRNLIVNAREAGLACGRGTRIAVDLEPAGHELALVVEDDGPGIPPEERARVLEPGYSRGKACGSGLGLTVVQEILAARGGRLEIGTSPLGGARFELTLPIVELPLGP